MENECLIKLTTQSFSLSYYPRSTKWQGEGIRGKGGVNFIYFAKIEILSTSQHDIARVEKPLTCKVWENKNKLLKINNNEQT
jgi:hypothetical protein